MCILRRFGVSVVYVLRNYRDVKYAPARYYVSKDNRGNGETFWGDIVRPSAELHHLYGVSVSQHSNKHAYQRTWQEISNILEDGINTSSSFPLLLLLCFRPLVVLHYHVYHIASIFMDTLMMWTDRYTNMRSNSRYISGLTVLHSSVTFLYFPDTHN